MDVTMTVVDDARAAALPIHETEARGELANILTADPGPVRGREIGGGRATPPGGQGRTAGPVPAPSRPTWVAKAKAGTGRRTRSLTKVVTSLAASRPSDTIVAAVNRDDTGFVLLILEISAKIITTHLVLDHQSCKGCYWFSCSLHRNYFSSVSFPDIFNDPPLLLARIIAWFCLSFP